MQWIKTIKRSENETILAKVRNCGVEGRNTKATVARGLNGRSSPTDWSIVGRLPSTTSLSSSSTSRKLWSPRTERPFSCASWHGPPPCSVAAAALWLSVRRPPPRRQRPHSTVELRPATANAFSMDVGGNTRPDRPRDVPADARRTAAFYDDDRWTVDVWRNRCFLRWLLRPALAVPSIAMNVSVCIHCGPCCFSNNSVKNERIVIILVRGITSDSMSSLEAISGFKLELEVATPYAPPLSSRGYHALTWRSHGHSVAAYLW